MLIDRSSARPAGACIKHGGRLWRTVQDCSDGYGRGIRFSEVTKLTQTDFAETTGTIIKPGPGWKGTRLHTLNRCGPLECIDGSARSFRYWPSWLTSKGINSLSDSKGQPTALASEPGLHADRNPKPRPTKLLGAGFGLTI